MKRFPAALAAFVMSLQVFSKINVYPGPAGKLKSADFAVSANNKTLFVYQARVSAVPINQVWPGYQRPLGQTELASFCYFDTDEETTIKIKSARKINSVVIRPLSYGIEPEVEGNTIKFKINKPCQVVVEVNGWHNSLIIFANPLEESSFDASGKDVLYFGPGIHKPGAIEAKDNQTIYVAGGAIVHSTISAKNIKNLRIAGRGIIDASSFKRGKAGYVVGARNCENITLDGVIFFLGNSG